MKDRILRNARWIAVSLALVGGAAFLAYALFPGSVDHPTSVTMEGAHDVQITASTPCDFAALAPGEAVYCGADVINAGPISMSLSITSLADNLDGLNLRDGIAMRVYGANGVAMTVADCPLELGTVEYNGIFGGDPAALLVLDGSVLAGESNVWCFRLTMPTDPAFADATTGGVITFSGIDA